MKKKTKKNLREDGIRAAIFGHLYFTGLQTEVLGFLQRGILATGKMNPDLDKKSELTKNDVNPKADFAMSFINSKGEKIAMEELRGKVIFINICATWCPPCIAEMPGINKRYKDVYNDKVAFIMLSVDQVFQKAIDFNANKGYDFEVYEVTGGMPQMYNTRSIPTTYVIDSGGNLVMTHMGMGDYNTKDFKEFLKEQY